MNEALYTKISDDLVEKGYSIIENALTREFSLRLLGLFDDSSRFVAAGISSKTKIHLDGKKRSTAISWLDEDGGTQSECLAFMNGLQRSLNRDLYLGLKFYESHLALYSVGDFYERHYDAFRFSKNRVVTTVYFLDDVWGEEDAGELLLFDEKGELLESLMPKMGRLVVFLSEKFPHEVLPTKRIRHSIAGWFRVDER